MGGKNGKTKRGVKAERVADEDEIESLDEELAEHEVDEEEEYAQGPEMWNSKLLTWFLLRV